MQINFTALSTIDVTFLLWLWTSSRWY